MKTLFLIRSHLRQHLVRNRVIFILFLIGGIINSIVFCYMYGNFLPAVRNKESTEIYYRRYRASIRVARQEGEVYPEEEYNAFLSGIQQVAGSDLFESVAIARRTRQSDVRAMVKGEPPVVKTKGSVRTPVGDEVILPFGNRHAIGERVKLFGLELTVIGQHTGEEFYVSQETLDKVGQSNTVFAVSKTHYDTKK